MWLHRHYSKSPLRAALQCILFISWLCYLSATAVNAHLRALPDPRSDALECNPTDCCFVIQHLTLFLPGTNIVAPLNVKFVERSSAVQDGWGGRWWRGGGAKPNYKHISIEENILFLLLLSGKKRKEKKRRNAGPDYFPHCQGTLGMLAATKIQLYKVQKIIRKK